MKKLLKKGLNISLIIILSTSIILSNILKVSAKMLTVNEISEGLKDSTIIKLLDSEDSKFSSKVNEDKKTLDLYAGEEILLSLNYTDEYLEYDNRDFVVTKDNCNGGIGEAFMLVGVLETLVNLSGNSLEGLTNDSEIELDLSYDEHGLEFISEPYNFSGTDEDGSSYNYSGNYLKYAKMSLDTSKIDNFVQEYKSAKKDNPILDLVPTLEAKEITSNSITLYPHVDYTPTDSEEKVNCYIYRSNEENGEYSRISDWAVNCLGSVGLKDENLESNTTYYYKAVVMDGDKFSNPIRVTTNPISEVTPLPDDTNTNTDNTPNNNSTDNSNTTSTEDINPETGAFLDTTLIITSLILITIVLYYIRKHRKFYNI